MKLTRSKLKEMIKHTLDELAVQKTLKLGSDLEVEIMDDGSAVMKTRRGVVNLSPKNYNILRQSIKRGKLKEFKSFSNRFHNSDTIRIKDKNEYTRIMKYLDKAKWPYYDIGGGKGAFHIQFDNTKDTMKIRGILQKKGFKIIDPNNEGKVRESDLPTTTRKDKTITVVHKTSGKELVVKDTSSARKKYKRMGYFAQADPRKIKKAIMIAKKMSGDMTGAVKKIERIEKDLSNNHDVANALKTANESINEAGMFDDYHELNPAYMKKFIKNYKKLNSKNLVKKKGDVVYGFRKGKREAHWKFDDDYKLHYDIDKTKALGLINFYNRAKKDHPWG